MSGVSLPSPPASFLSDAVEAEKIYIKQQSQTSKNGFVPELVQQIQALGYQTEVFSVEPPAAAQYYLTYNSGWVWSQGEHLVYFQANFFKQGKLLSIVVYDAKLGAENAYQQMSTAEKVQPLIETLLKDVKPAQ